MIPLVTSAIGIADQKPWESLGNGLKDDIKNAFTAKMRKPRGEAALGKKISRGCGIFWLFHNIQRGQPGECCSDVVLSWWDRKHMLLK